jgi:hypothetical protein
MPLPFDLAPGTRFRENVSGAGRKRRDPQSNRFPGIEGAWILVINHGHGKTRTRQQGSGGRADHACPDNHDIVFHKVHLVMAASS